MPEKSKRVRILCLNGGGVRGLFTINVLAEIERIIEQRTGQADVKAGDYFDLITGTSIGGILALGLAAGKSARELEAFFREQAPAIFPQRWALFNLLKSMICPRYSSKPLKKAIIEMIGENIIFNDLGRRVMIPAVNLSTGGPHFFKTPHNPAWTRDGGIKLVDAAMASSAAPTYFRPHFCPDLGSYFADGGLVANNPSFIGLHEVLRDMQSDFEDTRVDHVDILNIGTLGGEFTIRPKLLGSSWRQGYFGIWGGGSKLVLATMSANQILHKNMLLRELKNASDNFVTLDDKVPSEAASDISLDNASEESLRNLSTRGRQLATEQFTQNEKLQSLFDETAKPFVKRKLAKKENA